MFAKAILFLAAMCSAANAQLVAKTKHNIVLTEMPATVEAPVGATLYFWQVPAGVKVTEQVQHVLKFTAPDGNYSIMCKAITVDFANEKVDVKEYLGMFGVGESPAPEKDSDGDGVVDSKDKCPNTPAGTKVDKDGCPVVSDAPFPAPGYSVLMIEELNDRSKLPASQQAMIRRMSVSEVGQELRSRAIKVNGIPNWALVDEDYDRANFDENFSPSLKDGYFLLRDSVRDGRAVSSDGTVTNGRSPWLVVSNGRTGWQGPLPVNESDMLSVLRSVPK